MIFYSVLTYEFVQNFEKYLLILLTLRVSVEGNGNVKIIGSGTIMPNLKYTFSFTFPFIS